MRNNQDSPLLRLPPEIRNRIWHLALGGKLIRHNVYGRGRYRMMPRPSERENAFDLLRTCRQIYAETALLPFSANTFSWSFYSNLGTSVRAFRKFQCSQLLEVQFEMPASDLNDPWSKNYLKGVFGGLTLGKWLPGLQLIHFCVFPDPSWDVISFTACDAFLRSDIVPIMLLKGYEITIEKMNEGWWDFHQE